jgi:hypothetical protein
VSGKGKDLNRKGVLSIGFMKRIPVLVLLISLFVIPNALGQDTRVTATVDADTVGVQDQFQLSITISGRDSGDAENPRLPDMQDFKIVAGPSIGTQFQWINGRSSSSKSFTYVLIPKREGQFTIDAVEVRVGDRVYKTQPIQIRVTSAPQGSSPKRQRPFSPFDPFEGESVPSGNLNADAVFVRAELDRSSAYVGQQVTLSYQICTQIPITGIQLQENPSLSGFWVEDLEVDRNPSSTRQVINGREYSVYTIKKQALFPTMTGKLKIPSSTFAFSAGSTGGFLSLFDRTETLYRRNQELSIEIEPLPADGRPTDFGNAVGTFNLTTSIGKTQAATGEAVALEVKLEGQGNLRMIPDISLPPLPDFTIYSSKHADNIHSSKNDQIGGNKTWEYVIVPKAPGRQTIPALSFSYFNAEQGKYETVTSPALNLDVIVAEDSAGSISMLSGAGKQDLIRRGTDINFIMLTAGHLDKAHKPFYHSLWFYFIAAIPLAFNAGAFLYRKQYAKRTEDLSFARSRNAKRNALKKLRNAEREAKTDARRQYDRAAAALCGYLADKFNLSEIELTDDNLERTLSDRSIPQETVKEARACLQDCNFARFVSASASPDKIRELSSRIGKIIDVIERSVH